RSARAHGRVMLREVLVETGRHVMLVGVSVGVASAVGVPLGVWLTHRPGWSRIVLGLAGALQTIPSLALFGFLIPVPWIGGIGVRTALVALTLYGLLPVLRNTVTGIAGVDPAIREAGRGMGMTDAQLLWRVELPLAASVIIAGSKNFTEQRILGELLAQTVESVGLRAERKLDLGGTFVCDAAIRAGQIDMYVEYTGTALAAILKEKPEGMDRAQVLARVR